METLRRIRGLMGLLLLTTVFGLATPAYSELSEVQALKAEIEALKARKLECKDGKSVTGAINKWSAWSVCPEGYVATGLARVDIQGSHEVVTNHVNDFQCGDKGCRAWCIGNSCEVIARCCR